ncbi:orotidine-5'-phosphate decarboxylase [Candidatus Pantoea edessiphila]|uniref:Orotidine 5'-phosphate decarboxylase n=1 Tax=Candidatus Pantoea edessiphila TaxID=2044610 RepID=A0A2P5SYQ7_9GAMM|nr:orotidine-5'-phosphate decarboxylase [Candidatus Pantoea edessiphila]MBK4775406.1 orotidine-5'-phosphate decarboxylase [Pantoea sp. Edef]PPI87464.1 orotidine-5'-phosphate decarboxylase [Candidatus Pantoea edessiphila]
MIISKHLSQKLILALNFNSLKKTFKLIDQINPSSCYLKIGKEMFTLFGPYLIKELHKRHFSVFLDLKFHDIPNTTAYAISAAADLGVWMLNVHASGGIRMMLAAKKALLPLGKDAPFLVAVTILTSMDKEDLESLGIFSSPAEQAERLLKISQECGMDGVVCSVHEATRFRQITNKNFILVTPGIRAIGSSVDDQRRTMTLQQAKIAGVNYVVIGRPITQSETPINTLQKVLDILNNV